MVDLPFLYPSENISGFVGLINHANDLTNGMFGIAILIVVGVVSFMSSRTYGEKAWGFSAFLVFLSALLLRYAKLISDYVLFASIIFMIAVIVWIWRTKEEESV